MKRVYTKYLVIAHPHPSPRPWLNALDDEKVTDSYFIDIESTKRGPERFGPYQWDKLLSFTRRELPHCFREGTLPDEIKTWCIANGCKIKPVDDFGSRIEGFYVIPDDDVAEVALRLRWL